MKKNTPKQKKIPERRCTGCGGTFPKRDLVRVVRSPEGEISLDFKGKANGRGAYLCPDPMCLKKAIRAKALEHAFSSPIPEEVYARLNQEMETGE